MSRPFLHARLAAFVVLTAVLAGCGGQKETSPKENSASPEKPSVEQVDTNPVDEASSILTGPAVSPQMPDNQARQDSIDNLVDECVSEGVERDVCLCQIGVIEESLGEDRFANLLIAAESEDGTAAEKFLEDVTKNDPQTAMKLGSGILGCVGG